MALIKSKQIQAIASGKVQFTDNPSLSFLTAAKTSEWDAKYDAEDASGLTRGLMSSTHFTKLEGIAEGANLYTHPSEHDADMINDDTSVNKFVTAADKANWNDKYDQATIDNMLNDLSTGLEWQESVATFADIDTKYGSGGTITPEVGFVVSVDDESGQTYRYNGTIWEKFLSLGYNKATASNDGLMSKEDKSKLDGVAANANDYVHPDNHLPSVITQDANNRFVTDAEKTAWNAKAETTTADEANDGLMSKEDKAILNAGVSYQKDLVLTVANGQTSINTDITNNEAAPYTHLTNAVEGQLTVNGFKQTPGVDFSLSVVSDQIVISWDSSDFALEGSDVVIFTFTKLV